MAPISVLDKAAKSSSAASVNSMSREDSNQNGSAAGMEQEASNSECNIDFGSFKWLKEKHIDQLFPNDSDLGAKVRFEHFFGEFLSTETPSSSNTRPASTSSFIEYKKKNTSAAESFASNIDIDFKIWYPGKEDLLIVRWENFGSIIWDYFKNNIKDPESIEQYLNQYDHIIKIDENIGSSGSADSTTPCPLRAPLIVTVVGLPCRGKSLAAHRTARHLNWKGETTKVFTVDMDATPETLAEVQDWFNLRKNVAIIDGMHLTRKSRQLIAAFCKEHVYHHLIVEFDCDEKSIKSNMDEMIRYYRKTDNNTDWGQTFMEKIQHYASKYERCTAAESPLITVNNSEDPFEHSVTARGVQGALQTSILGVLSHPVIKEQQFYITRHGESDFNVIGRIGGDADLSPRGRKYAELLTHLFRENQNKLPGPELIWTSAFQRTIHTAENIPGPRAAVEDLNEIDAGICEGLTYEEIQERFPQEFVWRDQDKFKYRYPHGESYLDLLQRVDSVVQAILTKNHVLIVSHQAVLRCIMAYFMGTKPHKVPYINVPLHTLLVVRTNGYKFDVETIPLEVACVDTYRNKPKNCSAERTTADALGTVPPHLDAPLPHPLSQAI